MKSSRVNLILAICSIFVQRLLFETVVLDLYELPFASCLMIFESQKANIILMLYTMIPIPFILFMFSGMVQELTEGVGKLWIIRNYRKERLYLKVIGICAVKLLAVVICQVFVFSIEKRNWKSISGSQIGQIMVIYYLGILEIVLLQSVLELFIDVSYANLITNIFFVVSLVFGNVFLPIEEMKWLGVVFFPNILFGGRNGIVHQEIMYIESNYLLCWLVFLIILTGGVSILRLNRKDIF